MDTYIISKDIKLFGTPVKTFPTGIGEAFANLMKMLSDNFNRSYYGIGYMKDGAMVYMAAAVEMYEGEGEKYNCVPYIIEKGIYMTETVTDWRNNTECIKDIFYKLIADERTDKTKPAIEWYKTDAEMVCMVKAITQ